ncbi:MULTISPECIES: hypothetical protein [Paenibacillus]|uniref:Phage head-tail adapter protein n=1 Tax=Paenibacillus odorifer TaxID=189426 RepID=A0AB36J3X1_9BACL|nr:hypothetical protein [Paenibacillus odorifer]MEC0131532.1 hypothetical protein [Paenibacillus odorifer]MEC0220315.1 hypothetical protein [Paenibacillus odorifer]OME11416.1 hypothetical protein BSK47_28980 [Paenibacillus odorifer]
MNHRMNTLLEVYRVGRQKDADDLFSDRKSGKVADLKCFVVKTQTDAKAESTPVIYIVKKTIGVPKNADVRISDEVLLFGRKYLVIDSNPRRYWRELLVTCEVKGSERA